MAWQSTNKFPPSSCQHKFELAFLALQQNKRSFVSSNHEWLNGAQKHLLLLAHQLTPEQGI
jgi:hypothetical protein